MSWLNKLLPPKIKKDSKKPSSGVPEGLWSKCAACEAVLYHTDHLFQIKTGLKNRP